MVVFTQLKWLNEQLKYLLFLTRAPQIALHPRVGVIPNDIIMILKSKIKMLLFSFFYANFFWVFQLEQWENFYRARHPFNCNNKVVWICRCKKYPIYGIPLLLGWRRQFLTTQTSTRVSYLAPCGRRLPSIRSVAKYLDITQSNLEISFFTFEAWVAWHTYDH